MENVTIYFIPVAIGTIVLLMVVVLIQCHRNRMIIKEKNRGIISRMLEKDVIAKELDKVRIEKDTIEKTLDRYLNQLTNPSETTQTDPV